MFNLIPRPSTSLAASQTPRLMVDSVSSWRAGRESVNCLNERTRRALASIDAGASVSLQRIQVAGWQAQRLLREHAVGGRS